MTTAFKIGVAEVDITPPAGHAMDGYIARTSPSTGTHDPLMAQVLILTRGNQRAAVVTLDLLAVSRSFSDPLRANIAALVGTTPDAVLVAASHTHAGPTGTQDWFPVGANTQLDTAMTAAIQARLLDAARRAADDVQPATLHSAAGTLDALGSDRNQPDQPVDLSVTALRFDGLDGQPRAVLFHHACHPTVLSAANTTYSADFPGAARRRLQNAYPGAIAMYLNGAAGNISTRFRRHDQSFAEGERLGGLLGNHVLELLARAEPNAPYLAATGAMLDLPLRRFTSETRTLMTTGNARLDTVRAEGAAIEADLRRAFAGQTIVTAEVSGLRIGPWALLAVPGEAFSDLAQQLRATDPGALVVGYANDYLGYFPTQHAIDDATYEALSSPYDAQAHEQLAELLARIARTLR